MYEKYELEFANKLEKETKKLQTKNGVDPLEKDKLSNTPSHILESQFERKENTKVKQLEVEHMKLVRELEKEYNRNI